MRTFDPATPAHADLAPLADHPWTRGTHRDATAHLVRLGWTPCGVGDWAVGLRSPSGHLAARVCPFDPAYAAFLDLCRRCDGNPYLPRVERAEALDGGGTMTVMEFLRPVEAPVADAVRRQWHERPTPVPASTRHARTGPAGDAPDAPAAAQPAPATADSATGDSVAAGPVAAGPVVPAPVVADDPDFAAAHRAACDVNAAYRGSMPWWDGIDLNAGNVRRALDGRLTLIDIFCMDGASLYAQVLADARVVRERMGEEHTRHLLDIPYIARESTPEEIDALRRAWER
ncbi:hypothetical protein [Streptomyces buecherae]|uniref:hypothetical protein n=1 Tax=Streptomyces buecherae TaxID=2763006 RepID=UPI001C271404|nr:hypothetical protein [Streptomyces buecherae]